ncbi:MAG TPA: S41 family peptidase [Planctomycetaceae bacterium]|nr:S41 family peptidase [Planctomycetaceae bacterium]
MASNARVGVWRLVAAVLLALAALPLSAADAERPQPKDADYYELMKVFVDTFEQIDRNYVTDVDRRELMEAAIKGMMVRLDPYSSFIGPEEVEDFERVVEQKFGGIGIQVNIDPESERLTVVSPLPGTPAYKAGVRAGDVIEEIEGQSTKGFSIEDAVKLMKGDPGSKVRIGVRHLGGSDVETLEVERAIIELDTVMGDKHRAEEWDFMLDPEHKVGYIRLTHFSRRTSEELVGALEQLKQEGMKGLVLDLRFNPGGLLSQAVQIADLFIESGRIVSTKGRNTPERVWEATRGGAYTGFPIAVLVNRYSASASEIVSACLQDHKRAIVVGERTWGKGSVQNVIDLEGGKSALKLTTASYHRPSGKNIHRFPEAKESDEWGVVPDEGYLVKMSPQEMHGYLEYRRERDILRESGPSGSDFKDKQLARAVDYLREQLGVKAADPADQPTEAPRPDTASGAAGGEKAGSNDSARLHVVPLQLAHPRALAS